MQNWLTPLMMEQRQYKEPLDMLRRFIESWQWQEETLALSRLRAEIDSMLEGLVPMDAQKLETFKDLSRRLKGSQNTLEASFHGRSAST